MSLLPTAGNKEVWGRDYQWHNVHTSSCICPFSSKVERKHT